MAYGEFYVERQGWARWPKTLVMCRKRGDGIERRRYVPECTCRWEPADYITEGDWWNTECGEAITWEPEGTPNFCPNCGGKVEVDA